MQEKIKEIRSVLSDLDTMLYILDGNFSKSQMDKDGSLGEELSCYKDSGTELQEILDELFKQHEKEILPTRD